MKYTTILFDADDTLLDFKRAEHDALFSVLSSYDLPTDDLTMSTYSKINESLWKLLEVGGITKNELKIERFKRLCEHFGFSTDPESMANNYVTALSEQSHLIPGAEALCRKISAAGYNMYIVTNGIKFIQTRRFNATVLPSLFKKVFISEELGYEKPRKEFFDAVGAQIDGYDPQKTLIIGDSVSSDIKGGINAGIDTCWYNPKRKARPEDLSVTYEVNALDEILKILDI